MESCATLVVDFECIFISTTLSIDYEKKKLYKLASRSYQLVGASDYLQKNLTIKLLTPK